MPQKAMALPSEAREICNVNELPEILGNSPVIDAQDVSGSFPKHFDLQARRIARTYAVSYATAATIAGLAYSVAR
jgi:hypothetical protein